MAIRRLTRSRTDRTIAGVCAGLADYFGVDVVLVRLLFVILSIAGAVIGGVIVYVAAWLIIPEGTISRAGARQARAEAFDDRQPDRRRLWRHCGILSGWTPRRSGLSGSSLSIFCGAIIGGVIAYLLAWLIIPQCDRYLLVDGGSCIYRVRMSGSSHVRPRR